MKTQSVASGVSPEERDDLLTTGRPVTDSLLSFLKSLPIAPDAQDAPLTPQQAEELNELISRVLSSLNLSGQPITTAGAAESSELLRQVLFSESFWKPATDFHSTLVGGPRASTSSEPRRRRDCIYFSSS